MSNFYFTTPDDREYELSSTTEVSVKEAAVVTKSPVESGKSLVDNYYLDNKIISFSGLITDVKVMGQDVRRSIFVDRWIDEIRGIRQRKDLLIVHYDLGQIVRNCVITQFDITKTKEQGNSGWLCNLVFQEVDISERARIVEIPEAKKEVKDETDSKAKTSSNNKEQVPEQLAESLAVKVGQVTGAL